MEKGMGTDANWESQRREKLDAAGDRRRSRRAGLLAGISVLAVVLVVAVAIFMAPGPSTTPAAKPLGEGLSDYNETLVSVAVSSVNDTAKFYNWNATSKTIRFFAVKGSDGQTRTAFDNAYCCYHKDMGERQEGTDIVCNMCNARYPIDELNRGNLNATMVTQCAPADLPHTVMGKYILIKKSDLEAGSYLFK
jgi:uncharacterized membrane protein